MLFSTPPYLAPNQRRQYHRLQEALYVLFFIAFFLLFQSFLFPYEKLSYTFGENQSNKNTLLLPTNNSFEPAQNGQITPHNNLSLLAYSWSALEDVSLTVRPSKKSLGDFTEQTVHIKRGHGAFFFPQESTVLDFPQDKNFFLFEDTYYQENNSVATAFVSKGAFESYYPAWFAQEINKEQFSQKKLSEEFLGFRPGTLLAFADGVFITGEDLTFSAFASPEVLLRLGYTFDHVRQVSAEEVGIYKRTSTLLPGALHPPGTLFFEQDSGTTFLLQANKLWPLAKEYQEFLTKNNNLVTLSLQEQNQMVSCNLTKHTVLNQYSCTASALSLLAAGDSYQVTILNSSGVPLDADHITVGLQASRQKENAFRILSNLRNNLLSRFGLTYE